MKMKQIILSTILLLTCFLTVYAQESEASVAITLERTACRGTCPVYSLTIFNDGTVQYLGESSVSVTGEQIGQIDAETVSLMLNAFAEAGYFDWDEAYDTENISDLPSVISSVTIDGETHQIVRYAGDSAPFLLPYLELWVDEIVNTEIWTGVQADIANIANFGTTAPITLMRDACYATCPVYNMALTEDGHMVYMGIANVEMIGVQEVEIDPTIITNIAETANAMGYFNWSSSYEERFITDQATVTTSISQGEHFNRIVRYSGDPNAPVGLLWIEESIQNLLSEFSAIE